MVEPGGDATPPTPEPSQTPLTPRPGNLAVALLLVALLFVNLYYDSHSGEYDGKYLTFGVIGLIAAVLGVDVSRIFRGKGD